MKKFLIISVALIVLAAGAFGYSLYRYIDVTRPAPAPTEAAESEPSTEATADEPKLDRGSLDDNGIFSENYDKAAAKVADMTKEQMVGQLLMGIVTDPAAAETDVKRYSLAGVLFDPSAFDYKTKDEVKEIIEKVRTAAPIGPILAAQEEGGNINTVSGHDAFYDVTFNSPRNILEAGGVAEVEKAEDEKALFLKELGFNLNLAPVVDMPDMYNQIMYSRSLSNDVNVVSTYAEYVSKFNQAKGVSVALKHFPGYGTIPDTMDSVVTDTRDANTIRAVDYQPFKAGSDAGAHFIMVSNVVVQGIDATHTAALSPQIHRELRENIGFTGIVMTDVLDRTDYSAYSDSRNPAVAAVLAGNDIILVNDYAAAFTAILAAVNDGTIDPAYLQQACTRTLAYKYQTGILE